MYAFAILCRFSVVKLNMKADLSATDTWREKSHQALGKESTLFTNELLISFPFQHPCTQGHWSSCDENDGCSKLVAIEFRQF